MNKVYKIAFRITLLLTAVVLTTVIILFSYQNWKMDAKLPVITGTIYFCIIFDLLYNRTTNSSN